MPGISPMTRSNIEVRSFDARGAKRPPRSLRGTIGRRAPRAMVALGLAAAVTSGAPSFAWAASPAQRAAALVKRMTLAEELSLVGSGLTGVPRLGIPPMLFSDGPNGVGNAAKGVTAFPTAVNIAASWDPALARQYGAALGAETAGKGRALIGAPTINIVRTPLWGRAAETLGEDPFLTGQLAASEVRGIQSQRVIAQVKHYAANNQEIGRFGPALLAPGVDVQVSKRALQEIYFPGFHAAVGPGGAASVMCSYNRINGTPSCQRPDTLGDLRTFGLRGFVGPDATLAIRDVLAAAKAGVNNFQLGSVASIGAGGSVVGAYAGGTIEAGILGSAVANGTLSRSVIDTDARNILIAFDRVGLLARPKLQHRALVSTAAHRRLATLISAEATVLLKNRGQVLPLTKGTGSIAVIGHDAGAGTQTAENGSPAVLPGRPVITPLAGIRARAPKGTHVSYTRGTKGVVALPVIPAKVLTPASGGGHGLSGTYYAAADFSGPPILNQTVGTIDFAGKQLAPLQPIPGTKAASARWTGTLTPPSSGVYRFSVAMSGIASLSINGRVIAHGNTEWITSAPSSPGAQPLSFHGNVALTANRKVKISVDYSTGLSIRGAELHVGWEPPNPMIARAVAAARHAKVAVVFANEVSSEGMDRTSLALPGDQDRLIAAVAKANPRTIVVLHTSGPVLMPWRSKVAAILEAWYPGQQSGAAIAKTLYGDVDPSGRLPVTFPASEAQGPTANNPARYPGVGNIAQYSEGIFVGYRYYDHNGQRPLFPFGYGLSYTSFSLSGLKVVKHGSGRYDATVRVRNTGHRAGAQVVELYVGDPASAGEPPRQLKAFAKVFLRPGASQNVSLKLDRSSFQVFNQASNRWTTTPGSYRIDAGTSSRDLPLKTSVAVS